MESCIYVSKARQFCPFLYHFPGGLNFTAALVILSVIEMMSAYFAGITENAHGQLHPANPDQVAKFKGLKDYPLNGRNMASCASILIYVVSLG